MEERVNFALNGMTAGAFSTAEDTMAFLASVPANLQTILERLRPIGLSDLTGVQP